MKFLNSPASWLLLLLFGARSIIEYTEACTMIAVGRNATVDGSTLIAHTDDAGGGAADLRLVRVPAQVHKPGAQRAVYSFFGGYPRLVATERGPHYAPKYENETIMTPLGYIPQVRNTYAYWDQDYGLMNEMQLSIGESTCGAKTVGWAKDVDYGYNLFGIAELSKVALERCDSARCAVQTMGDLAVEYGFYSEDSGDPNAPDYVNAAEALGIADRYGEAWVFHVLTGKNNASAVWAAQRVPDDHVAAVTNGFMIRVMDLNDTDTFMASSNVVSFAEEMGWWDEATQGPIDFTAAYGFHDINPIRPLYTGRRIWRIFDLLTPSMRLDSRLGLFTQYPTYPFSVKPDELVAVDRVMNILRDYYQDTPYDMTKGIAAGPFGSPVRYGGSNKGILGGWERSISMYRTVYSFVMQARGHLHDSVGGVMWYAQGTPYSSVYVPFSCRQDRVPDSYLLGKESKFTMQSAWWAFNFVHNWSLLRFNAISVDVRAKIADLQPMAFALREKLEDHVRHWTNVTKIDLYMQDHQNAFASDVVTQWWEFAWYLVGKFTDGYITTGEKPEEMLMPGYPAWWLELSDFSRWPGDTLIAKGPVKKDIKAFEDQQNASVSIVTSQQQQQPEEQGWTGIAIVQIVIGGVVGAILGGTTVVWFGANRRRAGYQGIV